MSLADELIADLDDLGEDELEETEENKDNDNDLLNDLDDLDDLEDEENKDENEKSKSMDHEEEKEMAIKVALAGKDDIHSIAKLASSKQLKDIMEVNINNIIDCLLTNNGFQNDSYIN